MNRIVKLSLTLAVTSIISLSRNVSAIEPVKSNSATAQHESREVHKVESEINADRDKIIEESKAITADKRKLKDADKASDKTSSDGVRNEIAQREAKIKDLKKEISDKKEQRYLLMNGKQKDEPRRTRRDAK